MSHNYTISEMEDLAYAWLEKAKKAESPEWKESCIQQYERCAAEVEKMHLAWGITC